MAPVRDRRLFAGLTVSVMMLGLMSRTSYARVLPTIVTDFSGDILWALMVFLLLATIFASWTLQRTAIVAGIFAATVEFSQLSDAAWLETVRGWPGMRLVLGYGFLYSDLVCYAIGIAAGWGIAGCCRRKLPAGESRD